jgi:hypothetical protein
VNVNKFLCSVDAGLVVHHAIEILGGNGTIEDFSPLPRLYREVPVQESWEGPHNTLMSQILRDALRSKMHDALLSATQELLLGVQAPALLAIRDRALSALEDARESLGALLRRDPLEAALHVRALVTRIGRISQAALLIDDAQQMAGEEGLGWLGAAAEFLLNRYAVAGYDPTADSTYPGLVGQVLGD